MILTHGANSLRRGPKLLYALDVEAFDINTLNDRGVQWETRAGRRAVDLSKVNGNLKLQFTSGSLQMLELMPEALGLSQLKNYRVELVVDHIDFVAATLTFGMEISAFSYGWLNRRGFWVGNYDVTIIDAAYRIENLNGTKAVVNRSNTMPWVTAWEYVIEGGERYIYCYIDDAVIAKVKRNILPMFLAITNYNGSSYNQSLQISAFRVFEI